MQTKNLKKGDVLWSRGEFAMTIAFVNQGRLGIKSEQGLIGLVGPESIIGESALLAEAGEVQRRRATVIAIEESVVVEFPASFVRDGTGVGMPRKVLRALIGQTVTNACFILAALPDVPLVVQSMSALIRSLSDSKEMVRDVKTWEDFSPSFAYLFALRDTVEVLRDRLVPKKHFKARSEALLRASAVLKDLVKDPDIARFIDRFIAVERERIEAVETA